MIFRYSEMEYRCGLGGTDMLTLVNKRFIYERREILPIQEYFLSAIPDTHVRTCMSMIDPTCGSGVTLLFAALSVVSPALIQRAIGQPAF